MGRGVQQLSTHGIARSGEDIPSVQSMQEMLMPLMLSALVLRKYYQSA